uniref:Ovule protein n=1 Tax=Globodera pallida TaxID=36090 RepID=A0A183C9Z1_GLOPA
MDPMSFPNYAFSPTAFEGYQTAKQQQKHPAVLNFVKLTLVMFSEHHPKKHRFCLAILINWPHNYVILQLCSVARGRLAHFATRSRRFCHSVHSDFGISQRVASFFCQCQRMADAKVAML